MATAAVDENAALTKTFDSKTTADLERVTDFEEDKEISPVNIGNVSVVQICDKNNYMFHYFQHDS